MKPSERPTLAELAGRDKWCCPRCGCAASKVIDSREMEPGVRRRVRVCLHCHTPMPSNTWEVPVPSGHVLKIVPAEGAA